MAAMGGPGPPVPLGPPGTGRVSGRARVVGIAGPSCSGKTTLAQLLVERLGPRAARLPLDAYYRDLATLAPALRADHNFDHPEALDHALLLRHVALLAEGRTVEVPLYRFDSHRRADRGRLLGPTDWLIVEGLFALHREELLELLDTRVFVDCDEAVCLSRRLRRDVRQRGRSADSVRAQFERTVRPMGRRFVLPTRSRAQLVLDGSATAQLNVERLVGLLEP